MQQQQRNHCCSLHSGIIVVLRPRRIQDHHKVDLKDGGALHLVVIHLQFAGGTRSHTGEKYDGVPCRTNDIEMKKPLLWDAGVLHASGGNSVAGKALTAGATKPVIHTVRAPRLAAGLVCQSLPRQAVNMTAALNEDGPSAKGLEVNPLPTCVEVYLPEPVGWWNGKQRNERCSCSQRPVCIEEAGQEADAQAGNL